MVEKLLYDKIQSVKKDFNEEFKQWAVTRLIFDTRKYPIYTDEENADTEFVRIGYSHLIERNFFTEQKGPTYYDYRGLGSYYGKGVAFGEIRYILNNYLEKIKNVIKIDKSELFGTLSQIINVQGNYRMVILIHPSNISEFTNNPNFIFEKKGALWGYYKDIPVYWTTELANNQLYIFRNDIGKIIVKSNANIEVSEIDKSDYGNIIRNNPHLTKNELINYVRVASGEEIKFLYQQSYENTLTQIHFIRIKIKV